MSAKRRFFVHVPITGTATFSVEAEDKEAAKLAVWDVVDSGEKPDVTWEYCEQIVEGNCFHGMQNEIEVTRDDLSALPAGEEPTPPAATGAVAVRVGPPLEFRAAPGSFELDSDPPAASDEGDRHG